MLLFTMRLAALSDGLPLKQPRHISSSNTPAVEFNTTDSELRNKFALININNLRNFIIPKSCTKYSSNK